LEDPLARAPSYLLGVQSSTVTPLKEGSKSIEECFRYH
jgi:hypothetical protein